MPSGKVKSAILSDVEKGISLHAITVLFPYVVEGNVSLSAKSKSSTLGPSSLNTSGLCQYSMTQFPAPQGPLIVSCVWNLPTTLSHIACIYDVLTN